MQFHSLGLTLVCLTAVHAIAVDYPAGEPGPATGRISDDQAVLGNRVIQCVWQRDGGRIGDLTVTNRHSGRTLRLADGAMPRVVLGDGRIVDLAALKPVEPLQLQAVAADEKGTRSADRFAGKRLTASFRDDPSGLEITWSAELRDQSNYITQRLELNAKKDTNIDALVFLDAAIAGAEQVGNVSGSVVLAGDVFLAVEHPLARNVVNGGQVRCELPRGNALRPGHPWRYSSVIGVVPEGQLRRGFLYYLERRAHLYRPFLHYNSWYHLNIARPDNHMTEDECRQAIEHIGRELVEKRGVKLDAFVWDDGWDDFNSLWGFHKDFPKGFTNLTPVAAKFNAAMGVWMSPWGGYGGPKKKRLAYGRSQGYETNDRGFSMAGPKYRAAFRDVCLKMMREHGVVFFKFDGMGGGNIGAGAQGKLADDVDAVLELTRIVRRENPDLFISATVGTWPSPFWTLYADSVWRQGGDTGFHGAGNTRQQWITYRDMYAFRRVVQQGPLHPLNSVMFHGLCVGERANPAKMSRDEKSVADEIWTMFGCGMGLQELYISPHLLTQPMWDDLAKAARWARTNADVLVDSHWIGGDPGTGEVYGWASWSPKMGIVVLRNPSDKTQSFALELARDLELPDRHLTDYLLKSPVGNQRVGQLHAAAVNPLSIEMQPFEVLVFEATVVPGGKTYDAKSYREKRAAREAARAEAMKKAFAGNWGYTYQGRSYEREFLPDGRANLYVDGKRSSAWDGFRWRVQGSELVVLKPNGQTESHRLKDPEHLLLPLDLGVAKRVKPSRD